MSRQKQVFDTNLVAHIWQRQDQDYGRNSNSNLFFEGSSIYIAMEGILK